MSNSIVKKIRTGSELDRFHASYSIVPWSGCWIWLRSVDDDGYGVHYFGGKKMFAHRRSLEIFKGLKLGKNFACHECDTPACVNPDHLFVGTCAENISDSVKKGRFTRGEKNFTSKLKEHQIYEILSSEESDLSLAIKYGVHPLTIRRVKDRESWKHLQVAA
jgi:hypothetical protein